MLQPKDTDWLNGYKTRLMYLPLKRDSLQTSGHIQNENRGWKKISHANRSQKETGKVIFISN